MADDELVIPYFETKLREHRRNRTLRERIWCKHLKRWMRTDAYKQRDWQTLGRMFVDQANDRSSLQKLSSTSHEPDLAALVNKMLESFITIIDRHLSRRGLPLLEGTEEVPREDRVSTVPNLPRVPREA